MDKNNEKTQKNSENMNVKKLVKFNQKTIERIIKMCDMEIKV